MNIFYKILSAIGLIIAIPTYIFMFICALIFSDTSMPDKLGKILFALIDLFNFPKRKCPKCGWYTSIALASSSWLNGEKYFCKVCLNSYNLSKE